MSPWDALWYIASAAPPGVLLVYTAPVSVTRGSSARGETRKAWPRLGTFAAFCKVRENDRSRTVLHRTFIRHDGLLRALSYGQSGDRKDAD